MSVYEQRGNEIGLLDFVSVMMDVFRISGVRILVAQEFVSKGLIVILL